MRRARDLSLLTQEGVLDMAALSHAIHLRDQHRCGAVMEVTKVDAATSRLLDRCAGGWVGAQVPVPALLPGRTEGGGQAPADFSRDNR